MSKYVWGCVVPFGTHHRFKCLTLVGVQHRWQLGKPALSAFALGVQDVHGQLDGDPAQLVLDVFLQGRASR